MIIYFGLLNTNIFRWDDINIGGFVIAGTIMAGISALGINEGAYMTEIVRAGIMAIDPGQMEAARSLGMTYGQAMRRIVLPQAARVIVPPLGNEFNNMLKTTSLLFVISVQELFVTFQILNGNGPTSFHPFELFLACAVWFLLLTTIWGFIQGIDRAAARKRHSRRAGVGGPGLDLTSVRLRIGRIRPRRRCAARWSRSAHDLLDVAGVDARDTDEVIVEARGRAQVLRNVRGAEGRSLSTCTTARSCSSSGRLARARRRSCAASTTSRRSTAARSRSTAS